MHDKQLTTRVRGLLDRLVDSRSKSKDFQEEVGDEVAREARELPRSGITLDAIDRAVGRSKKRRQEAVYILSELTDMPEVQARIGEWLTDPDPNWRSWLIQTVEHRRLTQFGSAIARMISEDQDPFCRNLAIHAAGTLRSLEALPVILAAAESRSANLSALAWALKDFASPECRPYLRDWFQAPEFPSSLRVVSAWGLAKLGDGDAMAFLVRMLDDPSVTTATSHRPGNSIRAAQAICDVKGWSFGWGKAAVAKTKKLLNDEQSPPC